MLVTPSYKLGPSIQDAWDVRTGAASDGLQMRPYLRYYYHYFDSMQVDSKDVCIVLIIKCLKVLTKVKYNKTKCSYG